MEEGDQLVKAVKQEMEKMRAKYSAMVQEMQVCVCGGVFLWCVCVGIRIFCVNVLWRTV